VKLGVMSTGPTLEHYLGAQARRSGYLLIVDLDTMQYLTVQNPIHAQHGRAAGTLFAQVLVQNNVDAILAGSVEPAIHQTLSKYGVKVFCHEREIVYRIIEKCRHSYQSVVSRKIEDRDSYERHERTTRNQPDA
jgi:predicted Fe-Mo cluster-binding NifX family protein